MTAIKNSTAARLVAGLTAVVMVMTSFTAFVGTAQAATDLDALCEMAASLGISSPEFDALCGDDDEMMMSGESYYIHHPSIDFEFTRNLYIGSRGNDVMMLQKVLNLDVDTMVAATGVGSAGFETEYFGEKTRAAVAKFQVKHGISPSLGYFYPLTRAEMNRMVEGEGSETPSAEGDELQVSAGDDIDDDQVGEGQVHVPTTAIEVEAGDDDVMISSITVEVTGGAADDVDSVSVWHDGVILDTDSVDSDDEAKLEFDLEIGDGDTEELVFSVSMESSFSNDGRTFQVEVIEIEADADVDGLPVDGARHEVNDSANFINTYTMELDTENSDLQVGDEDEMIGSINIENDNADNDDDSIFVQQLAVEQIGDADLDDLDNIYVEVDGENYDGDVMGDYVIFDFGDGVEIEENDDMDFDIYADIVGGVDSDSSDDIEFTLEDDDMLDWVLVVDDEDRFLAESDGSPAITTGGFEIEGGTGNSGDSDEVRDGNVVPGENDAEMASFDLDIEGENLVEGDVSIYFLADNPDTDTDAIELDDIKIWDEDGNLIASDDDVTVTATTTSISGGANDEEYQILVEFEDVMFEEGDMFYIITADIPDDAPDAMVYRTAFVEFDNFEGEDSEEDATIDTIAPDTDQTVQGPAVTIGVQDTLDNDTIESDEEGVELAVIVFDATESGEPVEVQTVSLDFTIGQVAGTPTFADITNCVLVDENGDEVSDEEDLSAATDQEFDLDSGFIVNDDEVVSVSLVCDINDDFVNTDTILVQVDETTGNHDVEPTISDEDVVITVDTAGTGSNDGEDITIADGTLTSQDGEEAEWESVRTGTLVSLGSVELDSDEVEGLLEEITFEVVGANLIKSGTPIMVSSDEAGDDVVLSFYKTTDGDYDVEEDEWDMDVMVEDGITELWFWAETRSAVSTEGGTLSINIEGDTDVYVDGDNYTVTDTTVAGVSVYSGLPVFTTEDVTSTDVNSDDVLMKFTITADGEDLVLASTTGVSVEVTGTATTGSVAIYYDNSDYDDAVDGTALSAGDLTIDEGETIYFVVKSATAVDEGDNDDKIRTTVDFDGNITVNGTAIDPIESDVDDFADNTESLVHTYTN